MKAPVDPAALLGEGLAELGILPAGPVQALLEKFIAEVERWNPRFGLVKYDGRQELVVKHVLDSLSAWSALREAVSGSGSMLDVGSGAGFPGIPLAIALPEASFTLLERMARRAAFLQTCTILLGLSRVKVSEGDLALMTGEFDAVTCRAVAPLGRLVEDIRRSAIHWRRIAAYKGRHARAREEMEEVERLLPGLFECELRPLHTPFLDEERCLVVLEPIRY